jgi:hypothetical protein
VSDTAKSTAPAATPDRDIQVGNAALRLAADEWTEWETFIASDGIRSIRMHGLSPAEWLRKRAGALEPVAFGGAQLDGVRRSTDS